MSKVIKNYTFDIVKKTITFLDYINIDLERINLIVNVTRGAVLYDPDNPNARGTVSENVLTLECGTGVMDNSDKLQIDYEEDSISMYRISDIDDASNPKYYGFLKADGGWYILREDSTYNTYRYAKGDSGYLIAWEYRTTLGTYDYFDVVF